MPNKDINVNKARSFSKKVEEGSEFITQSGRKIHNLFELYDVIFEMDDVEFNHHVNENKNDFKNWIYHIIKDLRLAEIIAPLKDKLEILSVIEKRIDNYKKYINKNIVKSKIKKVDKKVINIKGSKKGNSKKTKVVHKLKQGKSSSKRILVKSKAKKTIKNKKNAMKNNKLSKNSGIKSKIKKADILIYTDKKNINYFGKDDVRHIKTKVVNNDDYLQLKKERKIFQERGFDFIQGMFIGLVLGIIAARIIFGV